MSTELKPENEDEDDGPQCETGTKPCPFCGNTNVEQFTHRTCEVVICPKCSMYSYGGTPHHKWQNRTPDPRVKELEAKDRVNWEDVAREYARNETYFRNLLVKCGNAFGKASHIADSGDDMGDVLVAKVPELVEAAVSRIKELEAEIEREGK